MVRHVIMWKLKEELNAAERAEALNRIKQELEALVGEIEGLLSVSVLIQPIAGSNMDLMLDSSFADEAALEYYQDHPAHVKVKQFVKTVVASRACLDAEM